MATPTRILFVSDEVAPFTDKTETAKLVRILPEQLQDTGDFEVRILMPRYGTISERRNRLHEVIRLSGTEVTIGDRTETLKCKVASIPGIRLQVYFMDNRHYFKRKGIYHDKQGKLFEDNPERALFFAHAALKTIRNLGWKPDIVHGFGWIAGFVPMLLNTTYHTDEVYDGTRVYYTPNKVDFEAPVQKELVEVMELNADTEGKEATAVGQEFADRVILPPTLETDGPTAVFSTDTEEWLDQALSLYEIATDGVTA